MSVSDKASFLFRHTSLNGDRVYDEGHMIERERDEEVGAWLARRRSSERQHGADLQEASDLVVTVYSFGKERKKKQGANAAARRWHPGGDSSSVVADDLLHISVC
jgi:hypothetical protein